MKTKVGNGILEKYLVFNQNPKNIKQRFDVIYILGGTQDSFRAKFKVAQDLYKKGFCDKLLVARRPGPTCYDPVLNRNLTNDEWTIRELTNLDIKRKDIEFVEIDEGYFGTYSEAASLSEIAKSKHCDNMGMITSEYHTKRVRMSFGHFLDYGGIPFAVIGADYPVKFGDICVEFFKLLFYRYVLI